MDKQDKAIYWPEYYAWIGEHGELVTDEGIRHRSFDASLRAVIQFKKREENRLSEYGYIGVNGTGNQFAILYITQGYINTMHDYHFKKKEYYELWLEVAKKALATGKLCKGVYNDKAI